MMLFKSIYLYSFFFLIFGSIFCFKLICPTKEDLEQYQLSLSSNKDLSCSKERVTYIKTGAIKDIFFKDKISIRNYKVSCPKALVHINHQKNTPYISEYLENAIILLQEQEGTKSNCRVFQAETACYDYNAKALSSPELYFSLFDSFFPNSDEPRWQGVAKTATLLLKKRSSPTLQTGFTIFFTPEKV